jgi:2-isopropylmalate synthase
MKSNRIIIFDTTLRDGEQCPGASMNLREKLEVARQLARLKVDVIEAGFPVISEGDFEAVNTIAREIKGPIICGLARCVPKDIDAAGEAVKPAGKKGRIHVFLATSKIHRDFKLGKAEDEIIRLAIDGVKRAKSWVDDVEFSPEDASRTEPEFLVEVCKAVVKAGATTVNIPDTVGWAVPEQYGALIKRLYDSVPEFQSGKAVISVHCHNDLGLAVANSLAAVANGARQVECTVNGIGERAGNAALEEIVMAIKTRGDYYSGYSCALNAKEIVKASRLVSRMSGLVVQRSKAIVGENAFAHSSGIHQDGILKKRETYEIMDPQDVGWGTTELPLTKHSGRAAVAARLKHL